MLQNNVTFRDYQKMEEVNVSALLELLLSPKQFKHRLSHTRLETDAMRIGSAGHTAILEPMQFLREYVLQPGEFPDSKGVMKPATKRLQSCKDWWAEQKLAGVTVLTEDQYKLAESMQRAVRKHELANGLLKDGAPEVTMRWEDAETGIPCKGRLDWLTDTAIVDVKTTRHPSRYAFARQAAKLNYHTRLAWYQDGHALATGRGPEFRFPVFIVAVQNEAPFDVVVYRVPDEALAAGRAKYRGLLDTLAECIANDSWPGVAPDEIVSLDLPSYALNTNSGEGEPLTIGGVPIAI